MKFLNLLFSAFLVGASPQTIPDPDGWVSVERPDVYQEEFPEEEQGIWVVFSKEMEGEKFLVRFPDDPQYLYFPGGIQFDASQGLDRLRLQVKKKGALEIGSFFDERVQEIKDTPNAILLKAKRSAGNSRLDLFYRIDEKWVWERILSTPKLLYTFHTESPEMTGDAHRQFISSLDVFS